MKIPSSPHPDQPDQITADQNKEDNTPNSCALRLFSLIQIEWSQLS